jgi:hypothetical protein
MMRLFALFLVAIASTAMAPVVAYPDRMSCDTSSWVPGTAFGFMNIEKLTSAAAEAADKDASECEILVQPTIQCGEEISIRVVSGGRALGMKVATSGGGVLAAESSGVEQQGGENCFHTAGWSSVVSR